jgi:hypothetical protein
MKSQIHDIGDLEDRIDTVTVMERRRCMSFVSREDNSVWNHYSNVREALVREVRVSCFASSEQCPLQWTSPSRLSVSHRASAAGAYANSLP